MSEKDILKDQWVNDTLDVLKGKKAKVIYIPIDQFQTLQNSLNNFDYIMQQISNLRKDIQLMDDARPSFLRMKLMTKIHEHIITKYQNKSFRKYTLFYEIQTRYRETLEDAFITFVNQNDIKYIGGGWYKWVDKIE